MLVIGAIDSAQSSIRMMAYSFTAMDIMGSVWRTDIFVRYEHFLTNYDT